ncbi:MAG: metal ABC transporter permease [Bdellovibrionales bacterium]|nr:metal ABC transporter permease [Bdellovibrionales bacterium]
MSQVLTFLAAPFVMCLILVGIHCYLGIHVLARGVIFVDLSLAQVAALGTVGAYVLGYDHDHPMSYGISLVSTLVAAVFLSFANRRKDKISQEAVIGILYAFASAAVVLGVDKISHGAEHIKSALVGELLWVTWADVLKVALIYSAVSVVHYVFRKEFIAQSFGRKQSWKWDFLFYALFGVIITSSVHVAGVLLVFAFLIVPSVTSALFHDGVGPRLWLGWALGFTLSVLGMSLSYWLDMPAGALIVVVFTAVPLLLVLRPGGLKARSRA